MKRSARPPCRLRVFLGSVLGLLTAVLWAGDAAAAGPPTLAVAMDDSTRIYLLPSNGDGTFGAARFLQYLEYQGGYNPRAIAIADFDNDGDLDFVAGGWRNGRNDYYLFVNDGTDQFQSRGRVASVAVDGGWAMDMAAGDLDHDGNMDFVAGADSTQIIVALGDGKGGFTTSVQVVAGSNSRGCDLADFDGDGHLDLVRGTYADSGIRLHRGRGDGTFEAGTLLFNSGDPYGVTAADFDNDGFVDVIANAGGSGDAVIAFGRGDGTFDAPVAVPTLDANDYAALDAYDFDGDGNADVVMARHYGHDAWYYPGNGDGTFGAGIRIGSGTPDVALGVSAPPYSLPGAPVALVAPASQAVALSGTASFDGTGSTLPLSTWLWSFGDGATQGGVAAPSHAYGPEEGTFVVRLRVTDDLGATAYGPARVRVQGEVPVPGLAATTFGEAHAQAGVYTVPLDGTASTDDGAISAYSWDFGDGWSDDFEGGAGAWSAASGTWAVDAGAYVQSNQSESRAMSFAGSPLSSDYAIEADVTLVAGSGQEAMLYMRSPDPQNRYEFIFRGRGINDLLIYRTVNGGAAQLAWAPLPWAPLVGQVYRLRFEARGAHLTGSVDGSVFIEADDTTFPRGRVGLGTYTTQASFDNVVVESKGAGPTPSHAYPAGLYSVGLTVTDAAGQSATDAFPVTVAPEAAPVADPGGPYTLGEADAVGGVWTVAFDGSASTDDHPPLLKYEWDYDKTDGLSVQATGANPLHGYSAPGAYTATLTVTDQGLQSTSAEVPVTISAGTAPAAVVNAPAAVNEEAARGGLWTVSFDAAGTTDDTGVSRYVWDFGDGQGATTYYGAEGTAGCSVGTDLYGYGVPGDGLMIIGTQDSTQVRLVDLTTKAVLGTWNLGPFGYVWNVDPGDGKYFKVESDKPVLAYQSNLGAYHSTFVPSLAGSAVGREFLFYYKADEAFYVFAFDAATVSFYRTDGSLAAQKVLAAGAYWNPGVANNQFYRVTATGRVGMESVGSNGFAAVPSATGSNVGRLFYAATQQSTVGAYAVFAYGPATVTVTDLDTSAVFATQSLTIGETWYRNDVGTRRLKFESTGDVEVWAGGTEGGGAIADLGDDLTVTGGKDGREFYLHSLKGGAVIFGLYDGTEVTVDGSTLPDLLAADGYVRLVEGASYHVTTTKPVVIQVIGAANALNDVGTYLGGRSALRHRYGATGDYTLGLTAYDRAGLSGAAQTTVSVGQSQPPVASPGGPYTVDEHQATAGVWTVHLDGSASTDDFGLFKYEWDFDASNGVTVEATGPQVTTTYAATGDYTATLTVYDNALQTNQATALVSVRANDPPVADAGGPYAFGEEGARDGKFWVTFDGSGSTDDVRLYYYLWDFGDAYTDPFDGSAIDGARWLTAGATQSEALTLATGANSWGAAYAFSAKGFPREGGAVFQARVTPGVGGGYHHMMWGLSDGSGNYHHYYLPYALYFNGDNRWIYVYEGANSRGNLVQYTPGEAYDLRIVLKPLAGAAYYYKPAASADWTLLYTSDPATYTVYANVFKVGMTVHSGTHAMDDVRVEPKGTGPNPTHAYEAPGDYTVTLTVLDHALQPSAPSTAAVSLTAGAAPVADPGGPYTGGVNSLVRFNGTASADDVAIARYVWDFGDGHGGSGATATHFYRAEGAYTVTLTVYDNLLQSHSASTTIDVGPGAAPQAVAGGPYDGGAGGPPVYFNGSAPNDPHGVFQYEWSLSPLTEDFSAALDATRWVSGASGGSAAVTQAGGLVTVTNGPGWGSAYLVTTHGVERLAGTTLTARLRTPGGFGHFMIGWKDGETGTSYGNLVHGLYFTNGGSLQVYQDGGYWGSVGSYVSDTWYTVRIVLKAAGATYSIRADGDADWTVLFDTDYSGESNLRPALIGGDWDGGQVETDDWVVDGVKLYGRRPVYAYPVPGTFQAGLTVTDGAGQTSATSAVVQVAANLPPKVICVPWVSTDPRSAHVTWNDKEITLKGTVKDADAATYQWDFGDGSSSGELAVSDPYNLGVKHTYAGFPDGTPITATLTVRDAAGNVGTDTYKLVVKEKTLDVEIDASVDEALWYLHRNQERLGGRQGRWMANYGSYSASSTASAVQAFEINTHLETGDPEENPYVETVSRGLRYLFTQLRPVAIGVQTFGDPDTNANEIGVEVASDRPIYEGGMAMMALAASGTPLAVARTGPAGVAGRTYYDILTDMVDAYAWGQADSAWMQGGWRYGWNQDADNSACQWAALGMEAAESAFDVKVPQWVKDQNLIWLRYSNDGTGWGYTGGGNGPATTPSGLAQLAFDKVPTDDGRWSRAESFVAATWDNWYKDSRNYYALYALAKAFRIATPNEVTVIGDGTPWALDWYRDPQRGVARTVIDDQHADGWYQAVGVAPGGGDDHISVGAFRTAWGVVILSKTLFVKPPVANAGPDRVTALDWPLTFDASGSYHTDSSRSIVRYEWDFNGDGLYEVTTTNPVIVHAYTEAELGGRPAPGVPILVRVGLRVTDDNLPPKTAVDTALITVAEPPHPPTAVPGGPYKATAGIPIALDGSGSYDIDQAAGDFVARYGWELLGSAPYDFAEATGARPTYAWSTPGTYNVGLKVWDNGVLNDTNGNGQVDEDERLTDVQWTTVTVVGNLPPTADAGGPYTVEEGTALTVDGSASSDPNGDALSYAWDLDDDGIFDNGTAVTATRTFPAQGAYTVRLKVSDSLLEGTASATVTVTDGVPTAGFTWSPVPASEGAAIQFADTSVTPVDALSGWTWSFGDGAGSAEQSPSHAYAQDGTYTVTLTVTDADGSTDTVTHDVVVLNVAPTANAGVDQTVAGGESVTFTGAATDPGALDTLTYSWAFGDGDTALGATVTHTYAAGGDYTATLTVTDGDGGTGTDEAIVHVLADHRPVADAGGPYTGEEGAAIQLDASGSTDLDGDSLTYEWDLNIDGTYEVNAGTSATLSHVFSANGAYTVRVRVSDGTLSATASAAVTVTDRAPTAAFTWTPEPQAEGAAVTFTDQSTSSPDALASRAWTFGDGGTSSAQNPAHTYVQNGTYTVTLTVTDADGSTDAVSHTVTVTDRAPAAAFAWTPEPQAEGAAVTFTDESTSSPDALASWAWTFGDGGTSSAQNPAHTYVQNGTYTVTLTVTDADGSTSVVSHTATVSNAAPSVNAGQDLTAVEMQEVSFQGSASDPGTSDVLSYEWNFGDGSPPISGTLTPKHVFATDGTYTVTLTVSDGDGGTGVDTVTVTVQDSAPTAGFDWTPDPAQEGQAVSFTDSTTAGADALASWAWTFGDGGTSNARNPSHTYIDNGVFTATLTVTDADGSTSSATHPVTVSNGAPTADAGGDRSALEGQVVSFSGSASDPGTADALTYYWTFGDGGTATGQTPSHAYGDEGTYTVTLTVSDGQGGTETDTLTVTVSNVAPVLGALADVTGNEGQAVTFAASATDAGTADTLTYTWAFGDGATGSGATVTHTYADDGTYAVTVTVTDGDGGSDSGAVAAAIANVAPEAGTLSNRSVQAGDEVSFTAQATDAGTGDTLTYAWSFGDGGTASGPSAAHTYPSAGDYTVTLTVTDDDGASDTATATITVAPAPDGGGGGGGGGGCWIETLPAAQSGSLALILGALGLAVGLGRRKRP